MDSKHLMEWFAWKAWNADSMASSAETTWAECSAHSRLAHYQPAKWCVEGLWRPNPFLYNKKVPAEEARVVSRLLVGGQGLRGGDSWPYEPVTADNCCVFCLVRGSRAVESLVHVVFDCQTYAAARQRHGFAGLLEAGGAGIFTLHRDRWSWGQLRSIRRGLCDIWAMRARAAGVRQARLTKRLDQQAHELWQ